MSDAFLVKFDGCIPASLINTTPVANLKICAGDSTTLNTNLSCTVNWFSTPAGGNSITSGTSFNTPAITVTTNYYIEGVSCGIVPPRTAVEITVVTLPAVNVSVNNSVICQGQSATLTASGASIYSWTPSQGLTNILNTEATATPSESLTYTVVGVTGNCSNSGTVDLLVVPTPNPKISTSPLKVCPNSTLSLNATGATNYTWFPSSILSNFTGSSVTATLSSNINFTLLGANNIGLVNCTAQSALSVSLTGYSPANVSPNSTICEGDEVFLSASGGDNFIWSSTYPISNSSNSLIIVRPITSTIYSVTISTNELCGKEVTVLVSVNPKPKLFAGRDTVFNLKEPMFINAVGEGQIIWIVGDDIVCKVCPSTRVFPIHRQCYVAQAVSDLGCISTDDICIDVSNEYALYIPNSFTPNNDGLNDIFYINGFGISDITLTIYDRWGKKLFISGDQSIGWDGTYKGTKCKDDVYAFSIEYTSANRKRQLETGKIILIK